MIYIPRNLRLISKNKIIKISAFLNIFVNVGEGPISYLMHITNYVKWKDLEVALERQPDIKEQHLRKLNEEKQH